MSNTTYHSARHRRSRLRRASERVKAFLPFVLLFFGAIGVSAIVWSGIESQSVPTSTVQATAVASTGLVQGAEGTIVSYFHEGERHLALVEGGPYFAEETVLVEVDRLGKIVAPISTAETAFAVVGTFLLVFLFGALFLLVAALVWDP